MRLDILENGQSTFQKIQMTLIRKMMDGLLPGPVAALSYRADFFGKAFNDTTQMALRKQKTWTKSEAELFAAFVSYHNRCQFCYGAHSAIAVNGMDESVVTAVMQNYETAPVNEQIRTTLGFLEKLTKFPEAVAAADLELMRAAGVTDDAIEEAIQICFVFCTINRLADAFDFEIAEGKGLERMGTMLYNLGYGIGSLPG
jgi:uncharacterized peroxidase-related enzyme